MARPWHIDVTKGGKKGTKRHARDKYGTAPSSWRAREKRRIKKHRKKQGRKKEKEERR